MALYPIFTPGSLWSTTAPSTNSELSKTLYLRTISKNTQPQEAKEGLATTKAALNRNKRKADTSNAAIDRLKREVSK